MNLDSLGDRPGWERPTLLSLGESWGILHRDELQNVVGSLRFGFGASHRHHHTVTST
jgi:hypothetical protein